MCAAALLATTHAAPFINEFSAENVGPILTSAGTLTGINDVNGNSSDWIELRNPDGAAVNLGGWALSDDPANPGKWIFPSTNLAADGYFRLFASGKDRAISNVQLHTNFKLGTTGVLLLSQPDGAGGWNVVHQIGTAATPYLRQKQRFSYGYAGSSGPTGTLGFFETQTPGAANTAPLLTEFVADTGFSVNRGFYDTAQTVALGSPTPLIYTVDGSEPTSINGIQVAAPDAITPPSATVEITKTTCLRARAVKSGLGPTNVDTHTYIFPAAVLGQNASYVTQPFTLWGHDKGDADSLHNEPDWSVDPRVVNHANPEDKLVVGDLLAIRASRSS